MRKYYRNRKRTFDMRGAHRFDTEDSTLFDLLSWRAAHQSRDVAYTFLNDREADTHSLTYGELEERARRIAARLQASGFAGERALLIYPPGLEFVTAFFGCLSGGVVPIPMRPPHAARLDREASTFLGIARDAEA